ncbi:hypothetical protein [Herbidospora sp. NBRC 101105]|uniref:hypothetical protein n=1 Tax=Herbidospora sp. NBRC 101105 TaxID=3032195 RepID=UPI0024A2FEE9|nr:hypothetical protein [Herbidospora sp. NBRC 101105]GLX97184.1 hypothetical protein Hesp01_51340 [Herbidospora sp. NBRC 101105]
MTDLSRLAGVLLLSSFTAMVAGVAVAVPSGLTLNPSDLDATLRAVHDQTGPHLLSLGLDVVGWLALTAAGLALAGLPGGLLAAAGLAGLLHDAGNLAVTQLTDDPGAALPVLLTAKWAVNLAGLVWTAATAAGAALLPLPRWLRRAGGLAALSGLAAVALPWPSGLAGPSAALEQAGYALHLPVMIWYVALGLRLVK